MTENLGTDKILLRVNELVAWLIPSLATVEVELSGIWIEVYLFKKYGENFVFCYMEGNSRIDNP